MKKSVFAFAAASSLLFATAAFSAPAADHAATWHGTGSNHQGNNNPGDTATDRHNFGGATAGKSGKNPAANSRKNND